MKRRLLIIAILLMAGAVVNVAVAWVCAVTINVHGVESEGARVFDEMMFGVDRWSRPGAVRVTCYRVRREVRVYRDWGSLDELLDDWTGFKVPTPEFQSGGSDLVGECRRVLRVRQDAPRTRESGYVKRRLLITAIFLLAGEG